MRSYRLLTQEAIRKLNDKVDNSEVPISYEEYKALSAEERNNGTNYFVYDLNSADNPFGNYLQKVEVVDNLNSTNTNLPLSANQGKILNDRLTANNTPFRFGYNAETNEYGYIVTDSEGADTFCPFSNAKKLYEALQYSGLVTEDMTYDEMCEVLSGAFGEKFSLLGLNWEFSTNATTHNTAIVNDEDQINLTVSAFTPTNSNVTMYYKSPEFYIDNFTLLTMLGTTYRVTSNSQAYYDLIINLVAVDTNTKTAIHQHSTTSASNTTKAVNISRNVASLTGRYYIEFYIGVYTGAEKGSYFNITKAELTS